MAFVITDWCELLEPSSTSFEGGDYDGTYKLGIGNITHAKLGEVLTYAADWAGTKAVVGEANNKNIIRNVPALLPTAKSITELYKYYLNSWTMQPEGSVNATRVARDGLYAAHHLYEGLPTSFTFKPNPNSTPFTADADIGTWTKTISATLYNFRREWDRWTHKEFQAKTELLTIDGAVLQFVENPDGGTPVTSGAMVAAKLGLIERKGTVKVTWKKVPYDYLFDSSGVPASIFNRLGTVNDASFLGYAKWTLLLQDAPRIRLYPQVIVSKAATVDVATVPLYADVEFEFIYFEPTKGNTGSAYTGHNLLPPRGQNYYLYATRVPFGTTPTPTTPVNAAAPALYTESDFRMLFAPCVE